MAEKTMLSMQVACGEKRLGIMCKCSGAYIQLRPIQDWRMTLYCLRLNLSALLTANSARSNSIDSPPGVKCLRKPNSLPLSALLLRFLLALPQGPRPWQPPLSPTFFPELPPRLRLLLKMFKTYKTNIISSSKR